MTKVLKGRVSGMQQRSEFALKKSWAVWDYRLERTSDDGKPLPRVAVEMRARRFDGSINNGDWIEVDGDWRPGEILHTRKVRNATTGVAVRARGLSRNQWIAINIAVVLMFIFVLITVGLAIFRHWGAMFGDRVQPRRL